MRVGLICVFASLAGLIVFAQLGTTQKNFGKNYELYSTIRTPRNLLSFAFCKLDTAIQATFHQWGGLKQAHLRRFSTAYPMEPPNLEDFS